MYNAEDISALHDDELIKRVKKGSEECFKILIYRYYTTVFTMVFYKITDKDLAKDLTQEIFIKVWEGIGKYNEKGSFRSWLYSITRNHITDYLRKNKSRLKYETHTELNKLTNSHIDSKNLSTTTELKELEDLILKALHTLPSEQQEIFILYYYFRLTVEEIAEKLEIPKGTVTSRLYLARKKLKEILKSWGIES